VAAQESVVSGATSTDAANGVGYGRPPTGTRFGKGQSGNPKGRPRGRRREIPYDSVLGQMVTVREGGRERRVTAAEAFLLQLTQKGLAGDSAAARASLEAIETARSKRPEVQGVRSVCMVMIQSGIDAVVGKVGIALKRNGKSEDKVRWEVQPWIVEAALARMAPRQLTPAQQQEVWQNTRTPDKVAWPDWWSVRR
jgi:hypothetical protein